MDQTPIRINGTEIVPPFWIQRERHEFMEKHGHYFKVENELPPEIEKGEERMCYANSFQTAWNHPKQYVYIEGYTFNPALPIPFSHAWIYDCDTGKAYDRTWDMTQKDENTLYLGLPFKIRYVADVFFKHEKYTSVVDNWADGWPVFSLPTETWKDNRLCGYNSTIASSAS